MRKLFARLIAWLFKRYSVRAAPFDYSKVNWTRGGPVRATPDIDFEFLGDNKETVGTVTIRMGLRVVGNGFVIVNETPVEFIAQQSVTIKAWRAWIGNVCMESPFPTVKLEPSDTYIAKEIVIPIHLNNFRPKDDSDDPMPVPVAPQDVKVN